MCRRDHFVIAQRGRDDKEMCPLFKMIELMTGKVPDGQYEEGM